MNLSNVRWLFQYQSGYRHRIISNENRDLYHYQPATFFFLLFSERCNTGRQAEIYSPSPINRTRKNNKKEKGAHKPSGESTWQSADHPAVSALTRSEDYLSENRYRISRHTHTNPKYTATKKGKKKKNPLKKVKNVSEKRTPISICGDQRQRWRRVITGRHRFVAIRWRLKVAVDFVLGGVLLTSSLSVCGAQWNKYREGANI